MHYSEQGANAPIHCLGPEPNIQWQRVVIDRCAKWQWNAVNCHIDSKPAVHGHPDAGFAKAIPL